MSDETPPEDRATAADGDDDARRVVDRTDEHLEHRRERLSAHLDREGLDAVWFARPNSFAWLTGGSNVVDRDADVGVAAAGYTRADGFVAVTDTIEADRLAREQLPEPFSLTATPWYESSLAEAVADATDGDGAADFDVPGFEAVDVSPLRRPLSPTDIERYRTLGREVAAAIERVARELQPADTEREAAAGLRITLASQGIEAPVVLVGGDERVQQYRHFTPTGAELGSYALLSVTAERGGLYASATRTVAFADAPEWLTDRHETAMRVEATALDATRRAVREGTDDPTMPSVETAGDVFDAVADAYDTLGEPEEWRAHHQGGATGYAGREWLATPESDESVEAPLAYAYNPSVRGTKSEDTVLLTGDDVEVLTGGERWPTQRVESAIEGSDFAIERHAVRRLDDA